MVVLKERKAVERIAIVVMTLGLIMTMRRRCMMKIDRLVAFTHILSNRQRKRAIL